MTYGDGLANVNLRLLKFHIKKLATMTAVRIKNKLNNHNKVTLFREKSKGG